MDSSSGNQGSECGALSSECEDAFLAAAAGGDRFASSMVFCVATINKCTFCACIASEHHQAACSTAEPSAPRIGQSHRWGRCVRNSSCIIHGLRRPEHNTVPGRSAAGHCATPANTLVMEIRDLAIEEANECGALSSECEDAFSAAVAGGDGFASSPWYFVSRQ